MRNRSSTGWPHTHAARGGTKMNTEDIDVFIGTGRRQDGPLGHGPEPGRAEGPRQGPAQRRGTSAFPLRQAGRSRTPAGGGRLARHHRGPGRGSGPGHGHHRGLPARTVDATHRRPDTGQRQDRRQGRGRHRPGRKDHAPHPESHQHLGRGRRGAEHADWLRPGPGPPGQPDRGPHPGPVVHPDPAQPSRPWWGPGRAHDAVLEARRRLAHPSQAEERGQGKD